VTREIQILWAGRHERGGWDDLCSLYRDRIRHFVPIEDRVVKSRFAKDPQARIRGESSALLDALPKSAWVVALDRRGRQVSSEAFARRLEKLRDDWPHPVVFVLGSDLGLGAEVLTRAREKLSLGKMTLPHQLARLVLYEQIYRALSITAGMKYHREPL
jgi:23S rRNA (pseudouridine1915-N3)-methyltransferase